MQNFPQITNALSSQHETVVSGTLQSTPGTGFRIEFFASAEADSSGHGEGQTYLGFVSAGADDFGTANFVASFSTFVPAGQFITATATDPSDNTSEFSASIPVAGRSVERRSPPQSDNRRVVHHHFTAGHHAHSVDYHGSRRGTAEWN